MILQAIMSKMSVMAMAILHTCNRSLSVAEVSPARSRSAIQPCCPSEVALPLRSSSGATAVSRGPSSNSNMSPSCTVATAGEGSPSDSQRSTFSVEHTMKGFRMDCTKVVPRLPVVVTQPVAPSRRARAWTRKGRGPAVAASSGSWHGPSKTSNISPSSRSRIFCASQALMISSVEVMDIGLQTTTKSCTTSASSDLRTPRSAGVFDRRTESPCSGCTSSPGSSLSSVSS
mmetsp:Transcript_49310/g.142888  ORF Transcript_49310/g.142888 Transcript_49310/m.142888 type:complete len:230 (+) Transcript_49310:463-1152(+)